MPTALHPARCQLRRNVLALGGDFAFFMAAMAATSPSTIVPAFATHLGASNLVIGAVPAVMTLGWFLPSIFVAGHTETLARKMPFTLRWTVLERVPYLVLAAAAFWLAERAPGATLVLLLAALGAVSGTGGVLMPAWMDLVGRAIPVQLRGRFFAGASAVGHLGGVPASLAAAAILAAVPAPRGYGYCFLLTAALMAVSLACFLFTREPPAAGPARPPVPLLAYLRRMPGLLRGDANFSWFLAARAAAVTGQMASGFFTVYALRALDAPAWKAGVFTTAMLAGLVGANVLLGWLADRAGHRLTLGLGVGAMALANGLAIAAPSLDAFTAVFALLGMNQAAIHVSGQTILLEFAPDESARPTYVGLGNSAMAPVAFASPFAAGALADAAGFRAVFAAAAAFCLLALILLAARVREPRHLGEAPLGP